MRVEVWLRPLPGAVTVDHELVAVWDFPSPDPATAAEKVWETTNSHPEELEGWEAAVRRAFDEVANGRTLGVGDVVVAGGVRMTCTPTGFDRG